MLEIMNNGPIVCSYEPPYDLFNYSSGVYHEVDEAEYIKKGMSKPEWQQVDHSNLCVGWGTTDKGVKYWIVQNTWGKDWGDNGRILFKRGTDVGGIESIAVRADPYVLRKENNTWVKVEPD